MASGSRLETLATWAEDPTTAPAIATALDALWLEAAAVRRSDDGRRNEAPGITRSGVLTLLTYATTPEARQRALDVMNALGDVHPGRSILLHSQPDARPAGLGAALTAYRQAGSSACCDQVQLSARGDATVHLAGVASWLARRELPVFLWWLGEPSLDDPQFSRLAGVSDVVIVDSATLSSPLSQIRQLARFQHRVGGRPGVADLNWDRLLEWRELAAQFFDATPARGCLTALTSVEIAFAADPRDSAVSAQALLLAGWLASCLDWEPTAVSRSPGQTNVRLRRDQGLVDLRLRGVASHTAPGSVVRLDLACPDEPKPTAFAVAADPRRAHGTTTTVIQGGSPVRRAFHFEQPSDARLLAEEIEALGVDCALSRALAATAQVAALIEDAPEAGQA